VVSTASLTPERHGSVDDSTAKHLVLFRVISWIVGLLQAENDPLNHTNKHEMRATGERSQLSVVDGPIFDLPF
jgi:hypothetical protein